MNVKLSKKEPVKKFKISPEIRYIGIHGIFVDDEVISSNGFSIKYRISNNNGQYEENDIYIDPGRIESCQTFKNDIGSQNLIGNMSHPNLSIEFSIRDKEIGNATISIDYQIMEYIPVDNPLNNFKNYLQDHSNSKILFSAPFGHGKTTFLQLFFDKYTKDFNKIHLFPVNYSVAQNRDIFEYIKCDILFSLLERGDIKYDKDKFNYLETLPDFVKGNVDKLLAPFLCLIPKVGRGLYTIYQELGKVVEEYFKNHKQQQIDDKNAAIELIKKVYNETGSIYEDDFQTQLIRHLLERLKESSNKENILIIDDLDRMDPSHVFRILNIFSAHFDAPDNIYESNKFGFDKIIIVCDYSNLAKIFAHKFGIDTDFAGYINKFFSNNIYFYNNLGVSMKVINWIEDSQPFFNDTLETMLKDMVYSQNLSLRELIKIRNLKGDVITHKADSTRSVKDHTSQKHYLNIIILLNILDLNVLIKKIKACSSEKSFIKYNKANYDFLSKSVIVERILKKGIQETNKFYYNDNEYTVELEQRPLNNYTIRSIAPIKEGVTIPHFDQSDYYKLLLLLIEESKDALLVI